MNSEHSFYSLSEEVSEIVEPSILFANGGYNDDVHHFIDLSFINLFSSLILYIVLPILTGIVSNKLSRLIKIRGGNKIRLGIENGSMHVKGDLVFIDGNIITESEMMAMMDEQKDEHGRLVTSAIDISKAEIAANALSEFLSSNGWPQSLSKNIANKIITHIINKLNKSNQ